MDEPIFANGPCPWNKDYICTEQKECETCERMPKPEDKVNGRKRPRRVKWVDEWGMHVPARPACDEFVTQADRCFFCGQPFVQDDRSLKEYMTPPEEVRMDCFHCGGKGTLVGYRVKCNGHFHGHCERCGCSVME